MNSPTPDQNGETIAHRICPLCEACCGLELTVKDGRVTAVRGHDADVLSAGYICPKAVALRDLHEDPDRLRHPLIKREGKFVPASWDEAFAEIERRLPPLIAAHGKDAVAVTLGNPTSHKAGLLLYGPRLLKALGTRNVFTASTLDQMPKQLSVGLMFGSWLSIPVPDIERTDFMLVLGANPMASNGSLWTVPDFRGKAKALRARGGRLWVIDPRRSETAALADRHIFIRPGGDVFLLLGMVNTLFAEKLVKPGHLAAHLNGLAELEAACAEFNAERMAARCGIEAATIRELARELAAARCSAFYSRIGACTQEYGTLASWLVDVISVLTGNLDREGGLMFPKSPSFAANTRGKPGSGQGVATGRHHSRVSKAPEVYGELPIGCLPEEIETAGDGQIKALISIASNPVLSAPNGERLAKALDTLDFMVSIDIYLNETSRHADVILPGMSALEHSHYDVPYPQFSWRNQARYSRAVLPPTPGQPAEWENMLRLIAIVRGLGANADLQALDDDYLANDVRRVAGDHADAVLRALTSWHGPERLIDLAIRSGPYGDQFGAKPDGLTLAKVAAAPGGIDLGPLQPRVPEVLRTPSGKIEMAPALCLADLQRVRDDLATPAADLVVVGRREVRSNNSWMHNLPTLAKGPYRCTTLVHPIDAARLGLRDGGRARITALGRGGQRSVDTEVALSDEMMPGVISLPHGWGHDLPGARLGLAAERPGVNLNALFDEDWRDPLSGNSVLSGMPVALAPLP